MSVLTVRHGTYAHHAGCRGVAGGRLMPRDEPAECIADLDISPSPERRRQTDYFGNIRPLT
jgi:hypothetical protein